MVETLSGGHSHRMRGLKDSKRYVSALLDEMSPSVGDKWATPHGQKFVISCIMPENDMPSCTCNTTGAVFKPHVILSSIFNRTTFGQLYEGFKAAMGVDISSYDPRVPGTSPTATCRGDDIHEGLICNASIADSYENRRDASGQSINVNFSVRRFWQLSHLVRDKQHYMSKIPRSLKPLQGRLSGAGVRLGERWKYKR
ncbi:unnamed protein product [Discosporangium mesarthrocarpum]